MEVGAGQVAHRLRRPSVRHGHRRDRPEIVVLRPRSTRTHADDRRDVGLPRGPRLRSDRRVWSRHSASLDRVRPRRRDAAIDQSMGPSAVYCRRTAGRLAAWYAPFPLDSPRRRGPRRRCGRGTTDESSRSRATRLRASRRPQDDCASRTAYDAFARISTRPYPASKPRATASRPAARLGRVVLHVHPSKAIPSRSSPASTAHDPGRRA